MIKKFFYSLAAVLVVGSSSMAAVIGTATAVTTFTTPDAALTGQGFTGYILRLSTDDGGLISAIDANITGPLHQRWSLDPDTGDETKTASALPTATGAFSNGDSKLTPLSGNIGVVAPSEDNSGTGSPLADTATRNYGMGSFLKGVWGIPGPSQLTTADVGYIVVPDQSRPNVSVTASVATSTGTFPVTIQLPGGVVENPILTSNPVPGAGIELDFGLLPTGQNPAPLPIALSNTGTGSPITVSGITLAGTNAANFVLTGTLPTSLAAGAAAQQFGVDWGTPGQPAGVYTAQVVVNTSAGNLVFDVSAEIPEPATLALAGLAVVGLVGFSRRK